MQKDTAIYQTTFHIPASLVVPAVIILLNFPTIGKYLELEFPEHDKKEH